MADGWLVTARPAGGAGVGASAVGAPAASPCAVGAAWRALVDVCAVAAGPFAASLLASWRQELDDVEARVAALRADASASPLDPLPVGLHALLALAGARLGARWPAAHLVDVAAAVELARHAVLQHEAVLDREHDPTSMNRQHVLRGDWSITQAARLVADIGPSAYRVLVRGWGSAQLLQLRTGQSAGRDALFETAISLGALTAGVPVQTPLRLPDRSCAVARMLGWATRL
jgi:hypothetical protein